jgi:mannose-6-phosphate isomerase-like protein (cupin superfamily)
MEAFEVETVAAEQRNSGLPYLEFLRSASLSAGLYVLPAGGVDPQRPHTEDEVYYIINGRGQIRVGSEDREVVPGSIVFVGARLEHRLHSITEDLEILVVFAPPEGSLTSR